MEKTTKRSSTSSSIILIRNTLPQNYGGGETYQLTLAQVLSDHHYHPIIMSSSSQLLEDAKKKKISSEKAPFLKNQNWSGFRNFFLPLYILWQHYLYFWYLHQFKRLNPKTVIIESRDDWIAATLAAKKLKIQILWLDHMDFRSWVLQNVEQKCKNAIGKKILRLAKYADRVIFISDFERNYFENLIKKTSIKNLTNLVTIKNGAIDSFSNYQNQVIEKDSFIYLGRLEEYKGIKELISAFSEVAPDFSTATLHIYGTGSLANYCEEHQTSQIIYHGFTDKPLEKIAAAETFVLVSHIEGLSLSLIDAAMLGKPIIATNVDGNPEVVQHQKNGILVPIKDVDSIVKALRKMLMNKELRIQYGQASRKKYLQDFNFPRTIKEQLIPIIEGK